MADVAARVGVSKMTVSRALKRSESSDRTTSEALRQRINRIDNCAVQWQAVADYLTDLGAQMERLPASPPAPQKLQEKSIA